MRSNIINTTRNRVALAFAAAILSATAIIGPAVSAQAVPPDDTYEISGTPAVVRPGGVITFTGTCWMNEDLGATTHVNVSGFLKPPAPEVPYDFRVFDIAVDPVDGSFSGRLPVPSDAPEGEYALTSQCITQDQVPGNGRDDFTVAGEPLPTTSTTSTPVTSTTVTVTSTTVGGTGSGGSTPSPAKPLPGTASFTG
jgi:hypothetical protein